MAFFSFLSPIVVIPAFFEHFGQFVEFMFRLYMNVIICRQTPPDFLNHYYIHDHYTSTTPKKKSDILHLIPRNMSGAPLFLKAPLMTGLEGTARPSRKTHGCWKVRNRRSHGAKVWSKRGEGEEALATIPTSRYVTLRDPCMVYVPTLTYRL